MTPSEKLVEQSYAAWQQQRGMASDTIAEALEVLRDSSKPTPDRVRDAKAILERYASIPTPEASEQVEGLRMAWFNAREGGEERVGVSVESLGAIIRAYDIAHAAEKL
jgi:hypothetical protein